MCSVLTVRTAKTNSGSRNAPGRSRNRKPTSHLIPFSCFAIKQHSAQRSSKQLLWGAWMLGCLKNDGGYGAQRFGGCSTTGKEGFLIAADPKKPKRIIQMRAGIQEEENASARFQ